MLSRVEVKDLRQHWDFVREGLRYIIEKTHQLWLPEDVYQHIKLESMYLYMQDSGDGFVILQPVNGWDATELYIFCGYSRGEHDLVMQDIAEIKDIAREMGAKRVKFQSPRRGFEKRAADMGYTVEFVQYQCELDPK